jgi:hypothetical protein
MGSATLRINRRDGDGYETQTFLTDLVERFTARVADDGSDYCRFELNADNGRYALRDLTHYFENWLGADFQVVTADRSVFRGIVSELILEVGGDAEKRALRDMANQAIVEYNGGETGIVQRADATESVTRYGPKLTRFQFNEVTSAVDAAAQASSLLQRLQISFPQPLAETERNKLTVLVAGSLWLLSWQETTVVAGTTVQAALRQIVSTTTNGIAFGYVGDNGATLTGDMTGTGLDLVRAVTALPSTDGRLWRFWIDPQNQANFAPIDVDPYYIKRTPRVQGAAVTYVTTRGSEQIGAWEAVAGVVRRNATYPIAGPVVGSPLLDRRDRYIEAVTFDAQGVHSFESLSAPEAVAYSVKTE